MSQFSGSPLQRLYFGLQTVVGTIPNTTGTLTAASLKLVPHIKAQIRRIVGLIANESKTGTASYLSGIPGKKSGSGDFEVDDMPSGAAGTVPSISAVLTNIFGAAATVVGATSATYNFVDGSANPLMAGLWNESGAGNTNQFAYGGVIQSWSEAIGGNGSARITFQCQFFYTLESDNWANEDTTGKAGLTVTPAEPGSPALAGNIVPGFAQTITFGGSAAAEFRSATIKGTTGRELRMDGVGFYSDTNITQGRRSVSLSSLKFQDSDGTVLATVKNAAASKTPMDVVITQGNVAGYIITRTLKAVQFGNATFSDSGGNIEIDFDDSPMHASALANTNEYVKQYA